MIADYPRASAVKCKELGRSQCFEDSLAFFNLNFGAVCPLNIEVCNTEPRPMHINTTGGIIDITRLIQQKHFFFFDKISELFTDEFSFARKQKSALLGKGLSMRLDDVKTSQR